MSEAKRDRKFKRTYNYTAGTGSLTTVDGTVLAEVTVSEVAAEVVKAFALQKAVAYIASSYENAIKNGKDAAARVALAVKELTDGEVDFRDGTAAVKGSSLYDLAEVLVSLGMSRITFPDKSKQEFSNVDECYAHLKVLWTAPSAVKGGPAGKGIINQIKAVPKVAAALAAGNDEAEDVIG